MNPIIELEPREVLIAVAYQCNTRGEERILMDVIAMSDAELREEVQKAMRRSTYEQIEKARALPMRTTPVTSDEVEDVYSGRPGCACGCRGKYSKDPKSALWRSVLKRANEAITGGYAELWDGTTHDMIVFDRSPTRTYTVYLKKAKKENA
jgi:hypothetical protein